MDNTYYHFLSVGKEYQESGITRLMVCYQLPPERVREIMNKKVLSDRKLSLYGEILVRREAALRLGCGLEQLKFARGGSGKPYLEGTPDFHFNITHTQGAVAAAFSSQPVGIDAEYKGREPNLRIARRFFSEEEYRYIMEESPLRSQRFLEIWTAKEAYVKWTGTGLTVPLSSFSVLKEEAAKKIKSFSIGKYQISLCGEAEASPEKGRLYTEKEFFSDLLP